MLNFIFYEIVVIIFATEFSGEFLKFQLEEVKAKIFYGSEFYHC